MHPGQVQPTNMAIRTTKSKQAQAQAQWKTFFHRCLLHRIDAAEFRELSKLLFQRYPINDAPLMDALLATRAAASAVKWDPLLPLYIDSLCKMGYVKISTVLTCLLKCSSVRDKSVSGAEAASDGDADATSASAKQKEDSTSKEKCYTLMTDNRVVQDVMLAISTGATAKMPLLEVIHAFSAVADWVLAIVGWHNGLLGAGQPVGMMGTPDGVLLFESVGILFAALAGTAKGLEVLSADSHEGLYHPSIAVIVVIRGVLSDRL
jgi:mediator of RNA polymerase II transcription subunit 5